MFVCVFACPHVFLRTRLAKPIKCIFLILPLKVRSKFLSDEIVCIALF